MKRILFLLLLISGTAYGQFAPTSAKTRFVNGIALGTRLDSYFNAADSNALYWRADSVVMAKYKGTARALAFDVSGGYVPYTGATQNVTIGNFRVSARTLLGDSIMARGSGGVSVYANNGTQVALLGAGGGSGTTLYGGLNGTTAYFNNVTTYDSTAKFFKRIIISPTGNSYFQDFGIGEDGPGVYINRNLDGGTDINEHGFIDATIFKNRTGRAYNSYDAQPRIAGSVNTDHVANFQSRGDVSLTGGATINTYWSFYSAPSVTSGNITNVYHFMNRPTIGSANVSNEYGLYVSQLRGTRKYAVYSAVDSAFFGNQVEALSFKKTGGTSSQFLKADGSVDATTYYPTSGGTVSGNVLADNLYSFNKIYLQRSSSSLNLPVASYWDGTTAPLTGTKGNIVAFGNAGSDGVSLVNSNAEVVRFDNTSFDIKNTTASTTTTTGALIVRGGAGIVGQVTANTLVKSGGTSTQALIADGSVLTLTSGTYTPTITGVANITTSSAATCYFTRVGNIVNVSGYVNITATANTYTEFRLSLPVSSTISTYSDLSGNGLYRFGSITHIPASIEGSSNEALFKLGTATNNGVSTQVQFSFTYRVM